MGWSLSVCIVLGALNWRQGSNVPEQRAVEAYGRTVVTLHATVDGVSQWTVLLTRYIYRLQFPRQPFFLSAPRFSSRVARRNGRAAVAARSAQAVDVRQFLHTDSLRRIGPQKPRATLRAFGLGRARRHQWFECLRRNIAPPPLFPPVSPTLYSVIVVRKRKVLCVYRWTNIWRCRLKLKSVA